MRTKTNARDFEIFVKECKKWIEIYGLKGWSVYYFHEHNNKIENALASIRFGSLDGRVASIFLEPDWQDNRVTSYQLRKSAFHEVGELLFARIGYLASYRYLRSGDEIEEETHNLIRILENVLWEVRE